MSRLFRSAHAPGELEVGPVKGSLLRVGASLFGAAVGVRKVVYQTGLVRPRRATRPVISVGNLTAGASGKTPFVILLAERLTAQGLRVAVLSRGYGRRAATDVPLVVSRGEGPLVDVEAAGDEPTLIARRTRALVVVDPRRHRAAELAVEALGAEVLILDDGFQHWGLARDLDVVMLDARQPFGNGALLPRGPLREPPAALGRAGLLVLNHGAADPGAGDLGAAADPGTVGAGAPAAVLSTALPVLEVEVVATGLDGEPARPVEALRGARVALLSGIGRPQRFVATVEGLGARVVHRSHFPDHAWIDAAQVGRFAEEARRAGAELFLTTEKDAVRLPLVAGLRLEPLVIAHRIRAGAEHLDAALAALLP